MVRVSLGRESATECQTGRGRKVGGQQRRWVIGDTNLGAAEERRTERAVGCSERASVQKAESREGGGSRGGKTAGRRKMDNSVITELRSCNAAMLVVVVVLG